MSRKELVTALQQARLEADFADQKLERIADQQSQVSSGIADLRVSLEREEQRLAKLERDHQQHIDEKFVALYKQRELAQVLVEVELGDIPENRVQRSIDGVAKAATLALAARDLIDAEVIDGSDEIADEDQPF